MVMGHAGLLSFAHRWGYTDPSEYNSSYVDILKMLCHIGHPGEMFTSAAPAGSHLLAAAWQCGALHDARAPARRSRAQDPR